MEAGGDLVYVRNLVRDLCGVVLDEGQEARLRMQLRQLADAEGCGTVEAFIARLKAEPFGDLRGKAVEAIVNADTWFFREEEHFAALRDIVIPDRMRRRSDGEPLRFWSAACSSGQEAYTLAMLIHEDFPELLDGKAEIVASDLSGRMLDRAREGRYTRFEVGRGLHAYYLQKYFAPRAFDWQVKEGLRRMVAFPQINLTRELPPLPRMDVILLRNVLIYFEVETKREVLARIKSLLKPGGYLFLGGVETVIGIDDSFERADLGGTFAYRSGSRSGAPGFPPR